MTRATDAFQRDPRSVMRYVLFEAPPLQHVLFAPQYTFVTDGEGRLMADVIGRVEDMQGSFDSICEKIGIPSRPLGQVNSSRRGAYRDYYDQQLIDGVTDLYHRDLELFGYEF